jgi:hypothetical protein
MKVNRWSFLSSQTCMQTCRWCWNMYFDNRDSDMNVGSSLHVWRGLVSFYLEGRCEWEMRCIFIDY